MSFTELISEVMFPLKFQGLLLIWPIYRKFIYIYMYIGHEVPKNKYFDNSIWAKIVWRYFKSLPLISYTYFIFLCFLYLPNKHSLIWILFFIMINFQVLCFNFLLALRYLIHIALTLQNDGFVKGLDSENKKTELTAV